MKNYYKYTLEDIINYNNLYESVNLCKQGYMWKESIAQFYAYKDFNINNILDQFYKSSYGYILHPLFHTIINERGTNRLICSIQTMDRVVNKCFNRNFLLPAFTPTFIYDNGASLVGKGLDFALNRFEYFLHNAFLEYGTNNFFALKLDIRHYFDNIYHPYVLHKINEHTNDPRVMEYFYNTLLQFQVDDFIHEGLKAPAGIGLGGEVNQTIGSLNLNELDHIIKEKFHIKYYVRYADDMILLHNDKKYLFYIMNEIETYLNNILHLELNKKKSMLIPVEDQGILFLKIHFYLSKSGKIYKKVYKETVKRIRRKMKSLYNFLEEGIVKFSDIRAFYSSSKGTLLRSDSIEQINALDQLFNTLFITNWMNSNEWIDYNSIEKELDSYLISR